MTLGKIHLRFEISRRDESRYRYVNLELLLVLIFFLLLAIGSLDNILNKSLEKNGVAGDLRRLFLDNMGRLPFLCLSFLTLDNYFSLAVTIHDILKF